MYSQSQTLVSLSTDQTIILTANNTYFNSWLGGDDSCNYFDISGTAVEIYGQLTSIIKGSPSTVAYANTFMGMFRNFQSRSTLIYADNLYLPTSFWDYSKGGIYFKMFQSSKIVTAPILRAEYIGSNYYREMFKDCILLTSKIVSYATGYQQTEAYGNVSPFHYMLDGAEKVKCIEVSCDTWPTYYGSNWVNGVASKGTFIKPLDLSVSFGPNRIPMYWTIVNKENGHMYYADPNNNYQSDYTKEVASVDDEGVITLTNGTIITP